MEGGVLFAIRPVMLPDRPILAQMGRLKNRRSPFNLATLNPSFLQTAPLEHHDRSLESASQSRPLFSPSAATNKPARALSRLRRRKRKRKEAGGNHGEGTHGTARQALRPGHHPRIQEVRSAPPLLLCLCYLHLVISRFDSV
jgi:hypothetical protein